MINVSNEIIEDLLNKKRSWLITGVAGFIGSNLLETLISLNQKVIGMDNFITGNKSNIESALRDASGENDSDFTFYEGDITNLEDCKRACEDVDIILHQAALGSVPRSIKDPITSNINNTNGFLNLITVAKDIGIEKFVYASSSSVYGDHKDLPKTEERIGKPLNPYAVTKYTNELYAMAFENSYNFNSIGLRYFNVFGKRQNPESMYAAVIPKWLKALMNNESVTIFGDGRTTRDFSHIDNAIEANLRAGLVDSNEAQNQVYNVALNQRTSLNELLELIQDYLCTKYGYTIKALPIYEDFREGDIRDSQANIDKATALLGYKPVTNIRVGIEKTIDWFVSNNNL